MSEEMDETWGVDNVEVQWTTDGTEDLTGIKINGDFIEVEPGAPFKDTIKEYTLAAGFGKFRVILNGEEIKPSLAPETFGEGDVVEIRLYDVAG